MAKNDIQGQILDKEGTVVEGATVYLFSQDNTNIVAQTTTDVNGEYIFKTHPDANGTTQNWHVAAQYDDGNELFNTASKPFISASLEQKVTIPDSVDYQLVASSYSEGSPWTDEIRGATMNDVGSPTKQTNDLNGEATIYLDGTSDGFDDIDAEITQNQPNAIVIVARHISGSGGSGRFYDSSDQGRQLLGADDGNGKVKQFAGNNSIGGSTSTNWRIYNALFDGSNSDLRVNGSTAFSGNAGANDLVNIVFGGDREFNNFHEMEIAEAWFMSSPSTQDRDDADFQMNDKYAIY